MAEPPKPDTKAPPAPAAPGAAPDAKKKLDFFSDEGPVLPGVPRKTAASEPAKRAAFPLDFKDPKVIAGGGIGLAVLMLLAWMLFGGSEAPTQTPQAAADTAGAAAPATSASAPPAAEAATAAAAAPPIVPLPGSVGTIEEFPTAWTAKKILVQKATGRVPALIIRLPGGSPRRADSYWGLLLTSPYGRCELEYLTDLRKITDDYGYRARHPMVVDPCNLTVFDPTRMGDIGGIIARGAVVQGTTLRPPLAIDLRIEGNRIIAVQTE